MLTKMLINRRGQRTHDPRSEREHSQRGEPPCNAAQDRSFRRLLLVGRLIWIVFIVLVVVTVIYVATATLQSG